MTSPKDTTAFPESKRARVRLAAELCQRLQSEEAEETDAKTVAELAADPKWEVRKAVSDNLEGLPEKLFVSLLAKLLDDPNQDVRNSAQRARRARTLNSTRRAQSAKADGHKDPFEKLGRVSGKRAVALGRQLATEQLDAVVGPAVHDIRNALQPIVHHAEELIGGDALTPEQKEKLTVILEQGRRSLRMIQTLRDFSKPIKLNLTQESLKELVEAAVAARPPARSATDAEIELHLEVGPGLRLCVDRDRLLCVFENLIKNAMEAFAVKHSRQEHPQVKITAESDEADALVRITIEDNGPGIPEEALEQLRKFLPGAGSNKPGSMGFGLPNVARAIRALGGSVSIDSEIDKWTRVTLVLPVNLEE